MDWLRQIPIGQYVSGKTSWMRYLDPRLKFCWVLMFLLTPILASSIWRVGLVGVLLLMTLLSRLPVRTWWRSVVVISILACLVGIFATLLPAGDPAAILSVRSPDELGDPFVNGSEWYVFSSGFIEFGPFTFGPIEIDRRSAELGVKTSTLVFTVVHSVNLMLLTTAPEDLMWTMRWFLSPLALIGFPVDRISFQLLLSLRFLPLVQEELQNLLRSLASRAVNWRQLGVKASLGLILSIGERLLKNILLRAEQGADALVARGGYFISGDYFRPKVITLTRSPLLNIGSSFLLILALGARGKYGAL